MQRQDSSRAWLALIRDRRWSAAEKIQLIEHFDSPDAVLGASDIELAQCLLRHSKKNTSSVLPRDTDRDMDWLSASNHFLIHYHHALYPPLLRQIPDPPLALFAIGDLSIMSDLGIAIVGSRRPTPVGIKMVESLAGELAQLGLVIVSGMAMGIDGYAHRAALHADGPSIAVMGCGLDRVHPARHRALFNDLSQRGLILSEYPLGYPATRYTFPERNRIVSGLSSGVVIIEAAQRSGTCITARLAMEQNREVMVVPGSALSSQYRGSHQLIQQGAALVMSVQDVLCCVAPELATSIDRVNRKEVFRAKPTNHQSARVLDCIGAESTSVDEIILGSGLTAAEVSSMLIMLELEGVVSRLGDGGYINLR